MFLPHWNRFQNLNFGFRGLTAALRMVASGFQRSRTARGATLLNARGFCGEPGQPASTVSAVLDVEAAERVSVRGEIWVTISAQATKFGQREVVLVAVSCFFHSNHVVK